MWHDALVSVVHISNAVLKTKVKESYIKNDYMMEWYKSLPKILSKVSTGCLNDSFAIALHLLISGLTDMNNYRLQKVFLNRKVNNTLVAKFDHSF